MVDFRKLLDSSGTLVMDGAMGTELQKLGMDDQSCYELCNLTSPQHVRKVHQSYIDAGSECLVTNTFQAHPQALQSHEMANRLSEITHTAIELARSVAGSQRPVLASVGPQESPTEKTLGPVIRSVRNADAILLETWSGGFEQAVDIALSEEFNLRSLPVCLSLTFLKGKDGKPCLYKSGQDAKTVADIVRRTGVTALGVNCGKDIGRNELRSILSGFRSVTGLPLFVRPNAGTPIQVNGSWHYPHSPHDMVQWVDDWVSLGVRMIGGCCGTTPAHIQAFSRRVKC